MIALTRQQKALLLECVTFTIRDVTNSIVTCPDEVEFAGDLDKLEKKREQLKWLKDLLEKAGLPVKEIT